MDVLILDDETGAQRNRQFTARRCVPTRNSQILPFDLGEATGVGYPCDRGYGTQPTLDTVSRPDSVTAIW